MHNNVAAKVFLVFLTILVGVCMGPTVLDWIRDGRISGIFYGPEGLGNYSEPMTVANRIQIVALYFIPIFGVFAGWIFLIRKNDFMAVSLSAFLVFVPSLLYMGWDGFAIWIKALVTNMPL